MQRPRPVRIAGPRGTNPHPVREDDLARFQRLAPQPRLGVSGRAAGGERQEEQEEERRADSPRAKSAQDSIGWSLSSPRDKGPHVRRVAAWAPRAAARSVSESHFELEGSRSARRWRI
ncbi:unnamed protein product [Lampetra fluviatilis]